jgi:hypothetical protein
MWLVLEHNKARSRLLSVLLLELGFSLHRGCGGWRLGRVLEVLKARTLVLAEWGRVVERECLK